MRMKTRWSGSLMKAIICSKAFCWPGLSVMLPVSLIVAEFEELESGFFLSVGQFLHYALGGGGHAGYVVFLQAFEQCHGEGHLAHEMDGGLLSVGDGKDFVEVLVGEAGDVLFIASRVDIGKGDVNDVAELLLCSSELCGVPQSGRMVGEVNQHSEGFF